jgi:hypothetical protein
MTDIGRQISGLYGNSSYDNPILKIEDWRLFCDEDGFLPVAGNVMLVGKCLAWNRSVDRYFLSFVGITDGAFEYKKGESFSNDVLARCRIGRRWFNDHDIEDIGPEIVASITELAELVCKSEGLENPLSVNPLTVEDISLPEKTLWIGESRGNKCRVIRREDWTISFQVASSYDANGDPDCWSVAW